MSMSQELFHKLFMPGRPVPLFFCVKTLGFLKGLKYIPVVLSSPILALHYVTATSHFDVLPRVGNKRPISADQASMSGYETR